LADSEVDDTIVATEHAPVQIDDFAGPGGARAQPLNHLRVMAGRHEADILAVVFVGDWQAEAARQLARLRLAAVAEWETLKIELCAGRGKQKVALIALRLARAVKRAATVRQRPRGDIVAGRQHAGAKLARGGQEISELYRLVAFHARHRRLSGNVAFGKPID